MTRATLSEVLTPALREGYAVAGFVCLGWEDTRAYLRAAEAEGRPVILQVGPGARAHMPLSVWAEMLKVLADEASVPVVSHLDHGMTIADCEEAIALGFTSVMFDGSKLPLVENIATTKYIAALAHAKGISCEGEIGYVGYASGASSEGTDPEEAARFAAETGVDAMAVSIGNVHLQEGQNASIDQARLDAIEALTQTPLVIHGGSGIPSAERRRLARHSNICKFNIGTELRQVFGRVLRAKLEAEPTLFDRIEILRAVEGPLEQAARKILRELG